MVSGPVRSELPMLELSAWRGAMLHVQAAAPSTAGSGFDIITVVGVPKWVYAHVLTFL